ncbi:hypothetical protein [Alicyclobacillus acidiphilus]|uniref:hypothetical protein n=1 Tax=Alicyclobacillus acidiphilus TaxID=182455 RepID=UPI000830F82C|nr:hypothetical protein [Alicyclobacillus acidiphilus]
MTKRLKRDADVQNRDIDSPNSGSYDPGPIEEGETDYPTAELWEAQSATYDLAVEEFPDGPYGAATNASRLGKSSDWLPGQAVSGRYRDANMIRSDRHVALHEPESDAPENTLESEN